MVAPLNEIELRVLGCLVEKELTTPEYYPLSLNALTNACNQKSNRDPVMALEEADVVRALDLLDVVLRQGGVTAVQLVMVLGTGLVGARLARALVDNGTPSGRLRGAVFERIKAARPPGLGKWSDEAASWADAAGLWTADELDRAIAAAAAADRGLKSTTISDERGLLVTMLLTLAEVGAAA